MEEVIGSGNLNRADKRVKANGEQAAAAAAKGLDLVGDRVAHSTAG
jgi:hypothetical protein